MRGRRGPAVHSPGRRSHRRSASRAQSRRRWLSGVIDEVAYGGAELVVVVDERLEVAAVDDPAVLGGELAEAGHDVNTFNLRLHRCKIAVWPELGSRYCKIRAGSETGSRSGCWRRRSPARWWTRRWMPPGGRNSPAGCSRRG